ncbi:hypothetical protein [Roseomonas sp. CECT 9278]|nr:hypothetical protein [Roseomonas sp. CECT 9278]
MIALDTDAPGQWWTTPVARAAHKLLATLSLLIHFCADGQVALRGR